MYPPRTQTNDFFLPRPNQTPLPGFLNWFEIHILKQNY